jgi:uncharacterized protein
VTAQASREHDLALVRAGIEATNNGDIDALLALLDPDIELHIAPGLGNAGTYHGHDGYRQGIGGWLEAWDDFTIHPVDIEPIGEGHVVCDARQSGRGRGSGIEVEMRLGYMFELRDGRVVRLHILDDRDAALAAALEGERE